MTRTSDALGVVRRAPTTIASAVAFALFGLSVCGPSADAASAKAVAAPSPSETAKFLPAAVQQRMLAQRPLQNAAGDIHAAVQAGTTPDFAGMVLRDGRLVVYHKGAPSAGLGRAVADARRTAAVTVQSAAYSLSELEDASDAVTEWLHAHPTSPIHSIDTPVDGSGLVLAADGPVNPSDIPATTVPVTVIQRPRIRLTSRLADTAPFWGGARMNHEQRPTTCTSGFGVIRNGVRYILTAGHCGAAYASSFRNGNNTVFMGSAVLENDPHDLLLVQGSAGGRIYDGGVGVGEFSKPVAGWKWTAPGEYVCTSGSVSGVICNIRNHESWTTQICGNDAWGHYGCYGDLVLAERLDGRTASLPGDSGGPVFGLTPDWGRVIAIGTITGGGGKWVAYQDFYTAWMDFGIVPVLG